MNIEIDVGSWVKTWGRGSNRVLGSSSELGVRIEFRINCHGWILNSDWSSPIWKLTPNMMPKLRPNLEFRLRTRHLYWTWYQNLDFTLMIISKSSPYPYSEPNLDTWFDTDNQIKIESYRPIWNLTWYRIQYQIVTLNSRFDPNLWPKIRHYLGSDLNTRLHYLIPI